MAAEADTVDDDTLNGRRYVSATSAGAVAAHLPHLRSQARQSVPPPAAHLQQQSTPLQIVSMPSAVTCTFVGEGSANAVFCVTPANDIANGRRSNGNNGSNGSNGENGTGTPAGDAGPLSAHLLRIPKAGPGVGPTTCLEHHAFYSDVLRPLVGTEWLVGQHLVRGIVSSGVSAILNDLLADMDRGRRSRPDWVGTRVAVDVDVALLVEDMTSACKRSPNPSTTTTIQCKPKWLVQSPSAPSGAHRCRTCALAAAAAAAAAAPSRAKGSHGRSGLAKKVAASPHKVKPCPLVLVADPPMTPREEAALDAALWDYVCQHMSSAVSSSSRSPASLPGKSSSAPSMALLKARPAIVRWLRTTDIFRRIAAIQAEFDPHGALSVTLEGPVSDGNASALALDRLQTAMTLRDCTCFLRVTTSDGTAPSQPAAISAKLGDLDRKNGRHKLARWQEQERALLAGGYYLGTEEPRQQTQCWLERQWE
ncbi:Inositol-pentakisphosphate 2-kinase [Sporothrix curviconia]|uniref:Inositol-pentakisphosphate 2-kinase n=1 Tax=Sporothrix curviconia TaxID=1260050 RepID=A0ABP0BJ42_9PEZI